MQILINAVEKWVMFKNSHLVERVFQTLVVNDVAICLQYDSESEIKNTHLSRFDSNGNVIWSCASPRKGDMNNGTDIFRQIQFVEDSLRAVTYCGVVFSVDWEKGSLEETGEWIK